MKCSGIYKITNNVSKKCYIGSSVDINQRWKQHRWNLNRSTHKNAHLQNSWKKYGEEAFTIEIVEECDRSILIEREQYYLDAMSPEYNVCSQAGSPMSGRKHTQASKRKIAEASSKQTISDETRKKISESLIGNKRTLGHRHTEEAKSKIALANSQRIVTEETREKLRIAGLKRKVSEETKQKIRESQLRRRHSDGVPPS